MKAGILIQGPKKGAIEAGRDAVMAILEITKEREDLTVQLALRAFVNVASIHDLTFTGGTFYIGSAEPPADPS